MSKKDIADSIDVYPAVISSPMFKALHADLLQTMKHVRGNILMLGLSPVASPYADNLDILDRMLGKEGRMLAIDYNPKVILNALIYLRSKAFPLRIALICQYSHMDFYCDNPGIKRLISEGRLSIDCLENIGGKVDVNGFDRRTMIILEHDLNRSLPLKDSMFDAVDATLSLHHIAAYKEQLVSVLKDTRRVLKPGGIIYYGDIFIDLRASERKIRRIASELAKVFGMRTVVCDCRNPEYPVHLEFYPASAENQPRPMPGFPLLSKPVITIDARARINISAMGKEREIIKCIRNLGYADYSIRKGTVIMPLIDQSVERQHVADVKAFHRVVRKLKRNMTGFTKAQIEASISRGNEEQRNCLKGLYEYFSDRRFVHQALTEAGYTKIKDTLVSLPDVGGIIAFKPNVVT